MLRRLVASRRQPQGTEPESRGVGKLAIHAAMGTVILIWGIAYTFIARALQDLPPLGLVSLRHIVAVAGFLVLFAFWPALRRLPDKQDIPRFLFLGFVTVIVYHLALYSGQEEIPPGSAALLVSCVPAMTAVLSFVVLRERMPPLKVAGLLLAFTGVGVVAALGTPGHELSTHIVGLSGIVLLAPISTALMTVFGKPLTKKYGGPHVATWTMVLGTTLLLPWAVPLSWGSYAHVSIDGWFSVLYLGLLSTTVAFVLYFWALARLQPTETTIYILLMPVAAVLFAAATLGTPITLFVALGGALVLSGVGLTNLASVRAAAAAATAAAKAASTPGREPEALKEAPAPR